MMEAKRIKIVKSLELCSMKLLRLAGREGVVSAHTANHKSRGCWVTLDRPYAGESEWFIPIQSIQILP